MLALFFQRDIQFLSARVLASIDFMRPPLPGVFVFPLYGADHLDACLANICLCNTLLMQQQH